MKEGAEMDCHSQTVHLCIEACPWGMRTWTFTALLVLRSSKAQPYRSSIMLHCAATAQHSAKCCEQMLK
eukprot:scaffold27009_cov30-Tisochrysis_lutea.AAC.1